MLNRQKIWAKSTNAISSRRYDTDSETYRGRSVAAGDGGAGIGVFEDRDGLVVKNRHRIRHSRGKYTMKEEIVKQMEINHPCKLTSTAVKISFPGMKEEVLVSFLGYKEPNLMHVNRCKGLCKVERRHDSFFYWIRIWIQKNKSKKSDPSPES